MPDEPPRWGTARWGAFRYTSRHAPARPLPFLSYKTKPTKHRPMNDELTNKLNMVGTCLTVANDAANTPVWTGKDPTDFGPDLTAIATAYGQATVLAARYGSAIDGVADDKEVTEAILEDAIFVLARALANHFKKTGDLTNRAKVAIRIGAIQKMRDRTLHDYGMEVRDLAQTASSHPDAGGRGIKAARIAALTGAIDAFGALLVAPRGEVISRSGLGSQLKALVSDLVEQLTDLDDLVIQFAGTPEGDRFIAAWKQARMVIDAGRGGGGEEEPPVTPPTP